MDWPFGHAQQASGGLPLLLLLMPLHSVVLAQSFEHPGGHIPGASHAQSEQCWQLSFTSQMPSWSQSIGGGQSGPSPGSQHPLPPCVTLPQSTLQLHADSPASQIWFPQVAGPTPVLLAAASGTDDVEVPETFALCVCDVDVVALRCPPCPPPGFVL